jgi:hypothetical protein
MKSNREPIKDWFGYTRRERRSAFILLLIIILIISLRYTVPERNTEIQNITSGLSGIESRAGFISNNNLHNGSTFSLDPNTAPYDTLIKPGLEPKKTNKLINYSNKGEKFKTFRYQKGFRNR